VLYELLAGRLPPRDAAATDAELPPPSRMLAGTNQPIDKTLRRKLRGDLDRIARLAVRQEPAARYASAAAFAADIEAWLEGRPVQAAGQTWTYLVGRFVRRHRFAVAAFVAALALIVGLALWLALALEQAHEAEATARRAATAAEQSTVFLEDLFGGLDPRARAGQPLDLDTWLERGRARIDGLAESPEARQRLLASLARVEINLGRHERALALLDQSDAVAVAQRPAAQVLATRLLRSRALSGASRYADARTEASAALAEAERLGLDAAAAEALVARGIAAMTLGDYEAAGADYDAAERRFAALGDEEGSASIAINRSIVAEYRGDYADAYALAVTARAHSRAKHGPDHPSALDAQFAEGKLLAYLGRNVEAVPVLVDLLARCERVFGPASSQTQRAVAELATTLQRTGRYSEALAAYERALAIARTLYGAGDHVQVSNHHANIAASLEERGEFTRAAELLTESAAMRERLFGAASPRRANALHALARGALAVGDLAAANRYADEALAIRRQALPEHDPWRLMSEALALEIAIARGELAGAEAEMARLETAVVARPEMELRTRIAILRAAAALAAARGDHAARLAALRREFELRAETYAPATHAVILDVRLRLAAALLAAGDTPGAKLELEAILPHAGEAFVAGAPQWQQFQKLQGDLARID
jgi:serine/threonine-protein kinase